LKRFEEDRGYGSGRSSFFFYFSPWMGSVRKRSYLWKRLFQFADLVLRMDLDGEEPKLILEKMPDKKWLAGGGKNQGIIAPS